MKMKTKQHILIQLTSNLFFLDKHFSMYFNNYPHPHLLSH